jgi:integrase
MVAAHPTVRSISQLERRHVDGWMRHLAEDLGRSEATRRVRLIALRKFLAYLATEPDIDLDRNPAESVALPTPKTKAVPVIHDDDLATLLRAVEKGSSFVDRRDAALIRVLIDTGCRRGELAGIDIDDVDLRTHDITLRRTKGGDERLVPIGAKTALALRKYLRARQKHAAASSPALFLSIRSGPRGGWRISGGGIAELLVRRCESVRLAPVHPHMFRHTWANDLLSHGANEGDVEKLAGWRSPLMVRRYGASAAAQRARDSSRRLARGDRV